MHNTENKIKITRGWNKTNGKERETRKERKKEKKWPNAQPRQKGAAAHATGKLGSSVCSESSAGGRSVAFFRVPAAPGETLRFPPLYGSAGSSQGLGSRNNLSLFASPSLLLFCGSLCESVWVCVFVAVFLCPLLVSVLIVSLLLPSLSFPFYDSFPFLSSSPRPFTSSPSSSFPLYRSSETL